MECSAIWQRLTKHLMDCHMYTEQSVHSTRGGKMLHISKQDGWEAAAEAGMILTKQVALRYIDQDRPTDYREDSK